MMILYWAWTWILLSWMWTLSTVAPLILWSKSFFLATRSCCGGCGCGDCSVAVVVDDNVGGGGGGGGGGTAMMMMMMMIREKGRLVDDMLG